MNRYFCLSCKRNKKGFADFEDQSKHMQKYHGWRKPKKKKNDLL